MAIRMRKLTSLFLLIVSPLQVLHAQLNINIATVSSANCRVLLENDQIRMLPYTLWHAQKDSPHTHLPRTDAQAVQQTVTNLFDALSNRHAEGVRRCCTRDVRFYEYGETWTADSLINKAIVRNTAIDFKRTNTLDFVSTTVNHDIAWTTYNLHSAITSNGKNVSVHWFETVVLVWEEKQWKVKVLHSTLIKKN